MENILIKFINLDRRPDRLELFYENIKKLDLDIEPNQMERFSAIDGNNLLADIQNKNYHNDEIFNYFKNNKRYATGELGCLLSHYFLLKQISLDDTIEDSKIIFIFEDDVFISEDFLKQNNFKDILQELPYFNKHYDWDLIYLGGKYQVNYLPSSRHIIINYEKIHTNFYKRNIEKEIKETKTTFNNSEFNRVTHCLIVNKKSAKKIIDSLLVFLKNNMVKNVHTGIDTIITKYLLDIIKIDYFPHIFYSPLNYKTDIQGDQNKKNVISGSKIIFQK